VRKCLIIPLVILALAVAAWPQARGGFGSGGFGRPGFGGGFGHSGFSGGFGHPGFGNRFGFPGSWVYFGSPLMYPDYPSPAEGLPSAPLVVVQSNPNPAPSEPPSEPLMIVWQGDHYVRYGGRAAPAQVRASADYLESDSSTGRSPSSVRSSSPGELNQSQLPPAVLVFRDGHREQVHDYVIASGKLYLRGDYWRDGYWTRTIELATLDVPRTLSANQENGVNFVLPTAPNEVVTRP
jgi:hypothetical protein